jgi:hypothetical protein
MSKICFVLPDTLKKELEEQAKENLTNLSAYMRGVLKKHVDAKKLKKD